MNTVKIDDKYIITSDGRVFTFWHNHKIFNPKEKELQGDRLNGGKHSL